MHEVGVLPKILATFLFISGLTVAIAPQFFIIETAPGVLSIAKPFGYPTSIIAVLIWLHLVLGYWGAAVIFRIIGRDMIGRKQLPKE